MPKKIDLKGQTFGDWVITEYLGKSTWRCINTVNNMTKDIHSYDLRTKYLNNKMVYKPKDYEDISGCVFNSWRALEYLGNGRWRCKCLDCNNEGIVSITDLKNGKSKRCNNPIHKLKDNLEGKTFGLWKVIEYAGEMRWKCECQCENHTIKSILTKDLINGRSKSCGCNRNYHIIHKDLTGKTFNNLLVLGYTGANNMWKCKCLACGNVNFITHRDSIITGKTKSCGCLKEKLRKDTLMEKYGDTNTTRIHNPREGWQIKVLESRENFLNYLNKLEPGQTTFTLSNKLNVNDDCILKAVHKFNLEDIVDLRPTYSKIELEIIDLIKELTPCKIEHGNRKILNGKELDIYIPEKKLAIEFNGNYWHSDKEKEMYDHQYKTIQCFTKGIHLIHIFEYEWINEDTRKKIVNYIKNLLNYNITKIYARDTLIKTIDNSECYDFLNSYHMQGSANASIKLGCFYKDELIGVMTFGKPRFNNDYQYELIRLCWKPNISVIGGSEKLFKYFLNNYKPKSILSYCDLTKFNGGVYFRLGFKTSANELTKPNYVWVSPDGKQIFTRYQTQKHLLIELGLGNEDDTEHAIMDNLGYLRIFDSGNIKFTWVD